MLAEGQLIVGFRLEKQLDTKSGEVWRASGQGKQVVLRKLPGGTQPKDLKARAAVSHPSVAHVLSTVREGVDAFAIAELLPGIDLARALSLRPRPPLAASLHVVREAARSLADAGIVHGAISASKLIISEDGSVRWADPCSFHPPAAPSPAPETAMGQPPTSATDVHVLAGLLWTLLTGKSPFGDEPGVNDFRRPIVPPQTIDAPPSVWLATSMALAFDPAQRFGSTAEFVRALDAIPSGDGQSELAAWIGRTRAAEPTPLPPGRSLNLPSDPFFEPERDVQINFGARFRVLARLGEGGMGEVYKVEDRELDEVVALKIVSKNAKDDPELLERLRREVRLARKISSPRVCRLHDLVELEGGVRGVTMALLRGKTLHALMSEGIRTDYARFAKWGADIAEGLAAAHELNVVHRDLKPENVMILSDDDRGVVLDFGVAVPANRDDSQRLTQKGIILGTLPYMSPEQLVDDALDGRSDLYALGLVLAELITGEIPCSAKTYRELLELRVLKPTRISVRDRDPQVPEGLARIIDSLLATNRQDRPATAGDVMSMLRQVQSDLASGRPTPVRAPSAPAVLSAPGAPSFLLEASPPATVTEQRRKPWLAVAAGAAVILSALGIAASRQPKVTSVPPAAPEKVSTPTSSPEPPATTVPDGGHPDAAAPDATPAVAPAAKPRPKAEPTAPLPM